MKNFIAAVVLALLAAAPARASYTNLPSTAAPTAYATVPSSFSFVACDASNGNSFTNTGHEVLLAYNSDSSAHSVTVTSVPDAIGRSGDSTKNVNGGAYYVFQNFPPTGWRQTDGTIHISCSNALMLFALISFP